MELEFRDQLVSVSFSLHLSFLLVLKVNVHIKPHQQVHFPTCAILPRKKFAEGERSKHMEKTQRIATEFLLYKHF